MQPRHVWFLAVSLALVACGDDGGSIIDAPAGDAPDSGDPRPGPVTAFTAADTPTGLVLSWTNPPDADLAGILVVAGTGGPVTFGPTDGMTYAPGMQVGAGQVVIGAAVATTLPFAALAAIDHAFSAWAVDAAGQYSLVATTAGRTDVLGVQVGMIQLFQDGRVVVVQQPPSLELSGTVVYDAKGDTMLADLSARNRTGRIVFNLKGLVDTASQGTVDNPPFPFEGGLPMAFFGPSGVAPDATHAATLGLSGIDGTMDPVVLTMHFVDAPAVLLQGGGAIKTKGGSNGIALVDTAGSGESGSISMSDQSCGRTQPRGSALSADARTLYTGAKSVARVTRFDLASFESTAGPLLPTTNDVGAVADVALSPDGTRLFAVLHDGSHLRGGAGTGGPCGGGKARKQGGRRDRLPGSGPRGAGFDLGVFGQLAPLGPLNAFGGGPIGALRLVELDPTTLGERRRATLSVAGTYGKLAILAGNRAVVTVEEGRVHLVDTTAMTEVDLDPVADGVQPLVLPTGDLYQAIGVAPDGGSFSIAVANDLGGYRVYSFDSATGAELATQDDMSVPSFQAVVGLSRAGNGDVLVAARSASKGPSGGALLRLDGTTATSIASWTEESPAGLAVRNGRWYVPLRRGGVSVFDAQTGDEQDTDGVASNGVTPLPLDQTPHSQGTLVVTPF